MAMRGGKAAGENEETQLMAKRQSSPTGGSIESEMAWRQRCRGNIAAIKLAGSAKTVAA